MTGTATADPPPRRRLEDQGRLGATIAWWTRYGQLITGLWLIVVSGAVLALALNVRSDQQRTRWQARDACQRTRAFAPSLAKAYARYSILTAAELAQYRRTIPRSCK